MKVMNKNRVIGILLSVALVVAVILSLLPMGIRLGMTYWLEQHGVQRVEIENVDLNLFSGVFALEGFSADDGLKVGQLAADIDWWPMKEHRIFIRSIEVKGFEVAAYQNEAGVWQISSIRLDEPTPESSEPEEVEEELGEPWQVVLNGIEIDDVKVKVKGALDKQPFDAALALKSLNIGLEKAEADGALWLKNSLKLGQVTFNGLGYAVKNGGLTLNNTLYLPALGSDMAAEFKINGMNLKLKDFSLLDNRSSVQMVNLDSAEMKQLNIAGTSKANFALLSLQGVVLPTAGDDTLGRVGQINLEGVDIDSAGAITLKKVAVNDLQAAIKKLKTGKILVLDQHQASARQDKAARVADVKDAKDKETSEPAADAGKMPVILVDEFSIAKGSSIAYRDESLFPPFDTKIEVERFTLTPIDLSGKKSGVLDVLLNLDKSGSLAINGDLNLNPDDLRSEIKVALKNFDMPKLTGFIEGDFGQAIKTGQFNMDSDIKVAKNKLDAKNKLLIRRLVLKKAKQPGKAEQSIGMPVDMALDMLRDDRGDITMDVPISGALDDPNINVNDVINQALMSSISGSAMTYAKLLLQPYGAIMMVAEYAVGAAQDAAKPKLTPIVFDERSAQLGEDMADYAGKIATLLMKTKAFRLQICGVAMRSEGESFELQPDESGKKMQRVERYPMGEEQLLNLGEARSNAVRQAVQAKGVAAERLFSCRAEIDEAAKKAEPRVELILD